MTCEICGKELARQRKRFCSRACQNTPLPDRMSVHTKKDTENGCWEWQAYCDTRSGYGIVGDGNRLKKAHRVAWELAHGPIPKNLSVCHRCDNPKCVNPAHLFLGTHADNMRDMTSKGRGMVPRIHGEAHYGSKITSAIVREIRASGELQRDLGKRFGLAQSTISQIKNGLRWKRVF